MIIPPAPYSYTGEVTTVSVPTLSGSYTYNGESQTPVWTYNENAISIFGQTSGVNAGEYEVTFSLNSKRAYQWSDGTKADKTGTWSIGKAQNTITFNPNSLSLTYYDRNGTVSVSYLGDGELSYSINNDNVTATRSGKIINVTASKTGNSIVTANVSEGTNYLAKSGTFNVAVDMAKNFTVTVNSDDSDMGSVSGGGTVKEGNSITITATPNTNYKFVSWTLNGEVVSTNATYTFTPTDDVDLTANFVELPIYTVTATIDPEDAGTVTGTGEYREGSTCTLVATVAQGYQFNGWQYNGITVSTNESYSFTVTEDRMFTAVFEVASRLPTGYTELQYITSNGNQSIDTQIKPNANCKYVIDVFPTRTGSSSNRSFIFCSAYDNTGNYFYTTFENGIYTRIGYAPYGDEYVSSTDGTPKRILITIDMPNNIVYVDSATQIIKNKSFYSGMPTIQLLSYDGFMLNLPANLYSFKVYTDNSLTMDLVPCTNPSGISGCYDMIGGKFFESVTSTPFIAGPSI